MDHEWTDLEERIIFEDLYEQYKANIFLYAYHSMALSGEAAQDVTSEAFLKLLEIWKNFEPKTAPAALAWLRRTVQYLAYNRKRRDLRLPTVSLQEVRDCEAVAVDSPGSYEEHLRRIRGALSPEDYRLFEEIVIEQKNLRQIAERMNVTPGAVKTRWFRLRKKIQKIL